MQTPNITQAQVLALVAAVVGAATVLFKLNVSDAEQAKIIGATTLVIVAAWPIGDAIIRHGRNSNAAAQAHLAAAQLQHLPADGDDALVPPAA